MSRVCEHGLRGGRCVSRAGGGSQTMEAPRLDSTTIAWYSAVKNIFIYVCIYRALNSGVQDVYMA